MKTSDLVLEFYDAAQDHSMITKYRDERRPKLTFLDLHKMRIAKDAQSVDKGDYIEFLPSMYSNAASPAVE